MALQDCYQVKIKRFAKDHRIIVLVVTMSLVGIVSWLIVGSVYCDRRNDNLPRYPVYPNSILETSIPSEGAGVKSRSTKYRVENEEFDSVYSFYEAYSTLCFGGNEDKTRQCSGKAEPYGDYRVFISKIDDRVTYTVISSWSVCVSGWVES